MENKKFVQENVPASWSGLQILLLGFIFGLTFLGAFLILRGQPHNQDSMPSSANIVRPLPPPVRRAWTLVPTRDGSWVEVFLPVSDEP